MDLYLGSSFFLRAFSAHPFLNLNSEFGIVLVLVVVLVLGALGFRDRKETEVLQLICSLSLIAKRSGILEDEHDGEDDSRQNYATVG